MFLGNEIKNSAGVIDWNKTYAEAEKHMKQVGLQESPHSLIKDIGTGKQQLVEIAKAFSKNVKLLTAHPQASYRLDRDVEKNYTLHITNPDLFWSTSKYLVVLVK